MSDIVDDAQRVEALLLEAAFSHRGKGVANAYQEIDEAGWPICLDCGERIPKARLTAVPTAVRCAECQTFVERRAAR